MTSTEVFEKHADELQKIGFLFYIFIRIESRLNSAIQTLFCDFNDLKSLVLNQALLKREIFGDSFERKRQLFRELIENLNNNKNNFSFDYDRWYKLSKDLEKIQKARNNLAHQFYNFSEPNKANFIKRNKSKTKEKEFFPFDTHEIDLDKEIEKSLKILEASHFEDDFITEAMPIVAKSQRVNLSEIWSE
jgi:hypothetical protein